MFIYIFGYLISYIDIGVYRPSCSDNSYEWGDDAVTILHTKYTENYLVTISYVIKCLFIDLVIMLVTLTLGFIEPFVATIVLNGDIPLQLYYSLNT